MRFLWIPLTVLCLDQATKVAIYLNMYPGQSIALLSDWLRLTFTQNPGMAFGITLGVANLVPVLAIVATTLIVLYILHVRDGYQPYVASLMVILGGALGNIIDRIFYGMIFGYGGFFQGRVVDFIHVDVWRGPLPETIPFVGGTPVALFPIWNVADMAIVLGVVGILFFQKEFHARLDLEKAASSPEATSDPSKSSVPTTQTDSLSPAVSPESASDTLPSNP